MTWIDALPDGYTAAVGGSHDYSEITDFIIADETFHEGGSHRSESETRMDLTGPHFVVDESLLQVRGPSGALAGVAIFMQNDPWVSSFVQHWSDPTSEQAAVVRAMALWAKEVAISRIPRAPGHAQVAMAFGAHSANSISIGVFEDLGFREERFFLEMVRTFDGPPEVAAMPAGITLRTMRLDEGVERLAPAQADAFKDHFGYTDQPIEQRIERWQHFRSQDDWDDSLVWLAEAGDEIAGANVCLRCHGADQTQGYVASLGVRRPWRGLGLARAMLTTAFAEYHRRGMASVSLHVDADSITGATRLYEGVGMVETNRYVDYELVVRDGEDLMVR